MRRIMAFLLLIALVVSFGGCAAESAPAATEAAIPETAAVESTEAETENTQPVREENLFLKVSSITFSLVGESEDIYLGLLPREQVVWHSEDPAVVDVDNGVLTAVGVGATTIYASYGDRQVSCSVSCLAQTQEELEQLDPEILSAPKRLPPEVDLSEPCTWFDNAAIVGDSITYFLWQTESKNDGLGKMTFVSRHGVSIHSLVNRSKNMYFEGHEMYLEDIVAKVNVPRIYIMLGCLDFQVDASRTLLMDHWEQLLDRIEEKAPDTEIVIVSNIPCFTEKTEPTVFNIAVEETTVKLRQLAADRGYGFLDLGYYVQDHYGRMPAIYCKDEFHMNDEGNLAWMKLLRFYAQFESEGGSIA